VVFGQDAPPTIQGVKIKIVGGSLHRGHGNSRHLKPAFQPICSAHDNMETEALLVTEVIF
jgi:hypothetical protein